MRQLQLISLTGLLLVGCVRAGFFAGAGADAAPGPATPDAASLDAAARDSGGAPAPAVEVYFARADGLGDDRYDGRSPATAFASLQRFLDVVDLARAAEGLHVYRLLLAATEDVQAYAPAQYAGPVRQSFQLELVGGQHFEQPVPRGAAEVSRIAASELGGLRAGLSIDYQGDSRHGAAAAVIARRLQFVDVRSALVLSMPGGLDGARPQLELTDATISSTEHGLLITYPHRYVGMGPTRVRLERVHIVAGRGLGGAPAHGLWVDSVQPNVELLDSTVTSLWGDGVLVTRHDALGNPAATDTYALDLQRSAIRGCTGHGLRWEDAETEVMYRWCDLHVRLDRVRLEDNGGSGLLVLMRPSSHDGSDSSQLYFEGQNLLVAGNRGDGLRLQAESPDPAVSTRLAAVHASLVSSSVVDNGGDCGFCSRSGHQSGGEHRIYNSLFVGNQHAVRIEDADGAGLALAENFNAFFGNRGDAVRLNGSAAALGSTDLVVDPRLAASPPDPQRPAIDSPLLDAGLQAYAPAQDLLGVARPQGAECSIGAYETAAP